MNRLQKINNNISVFSFAAVMLIFYSIYKFFTVDFSQPENTNVKIILLLVIAFAFVVLGFDYFLKKVFSNRIRLNVIQLLVAVSFIIIVYFEYFKLKN
jgi:CDP-diglyceride synthetase